MDGRRPADPLSDDLLDRELEAALNVEPSPEFVARVRTRVASELASPRWGMHWGVATATASLAVIALVLVAVVLQRGGEVTTGDAARSIERTSSTPAGVTEVPRPAAADAQSRSGTELPTQVARMPVVRPVEPNAPVRRAVANAPPTVARRPFPEVVISEDEKRAFDLLLASIDQERLPPLAEQTVTDARALEPMPLDIMPLMVEPLMPLARLE